MGTSLTGLTPSTTYDGLIKLSDNQPLEATAKYIGDGLGNDSVLSLSTTNVGIGTSAPTEQLVISNPTLNTTTVLIRNANFPSVSSSNSNLKFEQADSFSTSLQLAPGGVFNINTHGNVYPVQIRGTLSVNTSTPLTATVGIKGSGSTSATTSLLVQNSAGSQAIKITDDLVVNVGLTGPNNASLIVNGEFTVNAGVPSNINSGLNVSGILNVNGAAQSVGGLNTTRLCATTDLSVGFAGGAAASAVLECQSTTKGFLPPRMTTTQKNAIATPATGLVVYDTTTNKLCCYNGSTWNDLF